ncbi:hypothetical protein K8P10_001388 [Leucobacter sp. Psy1]|uniref:hypothetical protein n=1 Tax=Leucobacter sp. Psy1 TaxID=2875729 RepID=UPI001CD416ED|nr:hypothetical protein [Leucobacter sp. Psy1]UBH05877.1 hypothetical protein K8P10_001388 [Leucobacter sp. Psy1]
MTGTLAPTAKQKSLRRLGTAVLTGALALTGLTAAQVATAAPSEARVCAGKLDRSAGYAYAKNMCGWARAEVGRVIGGKQRIVRADVRNKAVSVRWTQGARSYERAMIW